MYERKETIVAVTGTMVAFFTTLDETEYSSYQQIVEIEFVQKALFYEYSAIENGVISHSLWENKQAYTTAASTVCTLCVETFNKNVDDYYADTTKFIRTIEENEF